MSNQYWTIHGKSVLQSDLTPKQLLLILKTVNRQYREKDAKFWKVPLQGLRKQRRDITMCFTYSVIESPTIGHGFNIVKIYDSKGEFFTKYHLESFGIRRIKSIIQDLFPNNIVKLNKR